MKISRGGLMEMDEKMMQEHLHDLTLREHQAFEDRMNLLFAGCDIGETSRIRLHENLLKDQDETIIEVEFIGGTKRYINASINSLEADLVEIAKLIHYEECTGLIENPESIKAIEKAIKDRTEAAR
jgi:hypothetical protein